MRFELYVPSIGFDHVIVGSARELPGFVTPKNEPSGNTVASGLARPTERLTWQFMLIVFSVLQLLPHPSEAFVAHAVV